MMPLREYHFATDISGMLKDPEVLPEGLEVI
jgi:hypothetical protein